MIEALCIQLPALVKATVRKDDGARLVEVEASAETVDQEGDLILQRALMDSAASFIATGHFDLEHLSERGASLGYKDPASYIVGRPTEVIDIGNKRTAVRGEIMRSPDGVHDPRRHRYDAFWDTFLTDPPVLWRASIYGFPKEGGVIDCTETECQGGARRYIVEGIDWRSLAFTRTPVNDALQGHARIITAKAYMGEFAKGLAASGAGDYLSPMPATPPAVSLLPHPLTMDELVGQYHRHMATHCPHVGGSNSVVGFRNHFMQCCGADFDAAEVSAHALMYHVVRERARAS